MTDLKRQGFPLVFQFHSYHKLLFHKILRSIDANHVSLSRCAKEFGWHVTLLRLITGPFGATRGVSNVNEKNGSVLEERRRGEEDLIDTVLEIVFRVMWKGVEGFGESDWKVNFVKLKCLQGWQYGKGVDFSAKFF